MAFKCPDCKGDGKMFCHVNHGDTRPHEWKWLPCARCKGDCELPDEVAEWIAEGQRLRDRRRRGQPYLSLGQMAALLGMKVSTYSQMELGYIMPYTLFPKDGA